MLLFKLCQALKLSRWFPYCVVLICDCFLYQFTSVIRAAAFIHFKYFNAHTSVTAANNMGNISSKIRNHHYKVDRTGGTLWRMQNYIFSFWIFFFFLWALLELRIPQEDSCFSSVPGLCVWPFGGVDEHAIKKIKARHTWFVGRCFKHNNSMLAPPLQLSLSESEWREGVALAATHHILYIV